eukprot:gene31505-6690_t
MACRFVFGSIHNLNGLKDLSSQVVESPNLLWDDVLPYVREHHVVFAGKTLAIPLDCNVELLHYRRDIFTAQGWDVPQTWDQLLSLAKEANGMDMNGDGVPDFGFCMEARSNCLVLGASIMGMVAPYLQYLGLTQGVYFDPETILDPTGRQLLVDNPAFRHVLGVYQELVQVSQQAGLFGNTSAGTDDTGCSLDVSPQLGVSLPPGSFEVLDRKRNILKPCNKTLCRYATQVVDQSTGVTSSAGVPRSHSWVSAVNNFSPVAPAQAVFNLLSSLSAQDGSWDLILHPTLPFTPFRYVHFSDLDRWLGAGFDRQDITQFLNASLAAVTHPNIVTDLRLAGLSG